LSIRLKVFVIILVLFAILGIADFFIQRCIIFPSFLELEHREASENLHRIHHAIVREVVHLDRLCHDWAMWDDSYAFIDEQSEAFIASNLNADTLTSDHLNLLLFCRLDGTILWGSGVQNQQPLDFPYLQSKKLAPDHPLLAQLQLAKSGMQSASGVLKSQFGPLLFSTQTILHSDGSGPGKGYLIMGRLLDQPTLEALREQTRIPFEIRYPLTEHTISCGPIEEAFTGQQQRLRFVEFNNSKFIQSCASYPGSNGKPVFEIQYLFPREISRKGLTSMGYAAALVITSGLIIVIFLNLTLQRAILRPIQQLTDHALAIEREKDFSKQINMERRDEIGKLAHSFDTMVQTIDKQTSDLHLANEQLIILTVQDGLTGIANRRMFDNYLNKEWRRALREQVPLSLIILDVDFFKQYNDTYGHQQGDRCLIAVAQTMQNTIRRPADLAARYGGEEFALVLPNTHEEGAMFIAERVRQRVQDLKLAHSVSEVSNYVSISLGVVTRIPQVGKDNQGPGILVQSADKALYQAKKQGRNRTVTARYADQGAL